jgi:diguanylate cyclase
MPGDSMMEFTDSPQQTAERARATLALIERHKVGLSPRNYAIWYAYVSGVPAELVKALDIVISNGIEYTDDISRGLFDRFLAAPPPQLAGDVNERLGKQLRDAMRILDEAGAGTQAYGKALRSAVGQLAGDGGLKTVREVIASLVAETQVMTDRTRALEVRLDGASKEIDKLRQTLDRARRETMTDALTEIGNRKLFDLKLREEAMHAMETGEAMSLLMTDIDHFKKFNDTHGHQMGDQVLRLVARTLTENLKGRDTSTRYGGEEFAIILPGTAIGPAAVVAEQLRQRVATRHLVRRNTQEKLGAITLSIGAAQFRMGEKLADLIQRADEALYRAKASGRNRVAIEDPAPSTASAAAD